MKRRPQRGTELIALSEQFREPLYGRLQQEHPPSLCAGEVHLLAVGQLAAVAYVMVRGVDPTPNGQLDGGLAAMFRLIDGVRLVTNDVMRANLDGSGCDRPLDAFGINEWAERYSVYRGTWGVCAGP